MSDPTREGGPTLFELAGGEPALRAVVRTFYDKVFDDVMIGFHFWRSDKERLIDREYEFAARALGARHVEYRGRPMREAHAPHPILSGQFDRRRVILEEAIDAHGLPEPVKRAWLEHTDRLRAVIINDDTDCVQETP